MTRDSQERTIREDWIGRQRTLGNRPRAVLMKGLHPLINETIDLWHRSVMRSAFDGVASTSQDGHTLDLGCGYGRLADQARSCGLSPVVGLDFTHQFCVDFQRHHGPAVCGALSRLPFADASIANAYSVTSLMYLSVEDARRALHELDRCLVEGARILVLEPSREFNGLVRFVLRQKRNEVLARPGFALSELNGEIAPPNWRRLNAGSSAWMTALLPALLVATRLPKVYGWLSGKVLRLDRPAPAPGKALGKYSMYRWAVYRKS